MSFDWKQKVWLAPLTAMLAITLVGWWCKTEVKGSIEQHLIIHLQAILKSKITSLRIWIDNQMRLVEILASEERTRSLIWAVVAQAKQDGATGEILRASQESRELRENLLSRLRTEGLEFVVTDAEGAIIASPNDGRLGERLNDSVLEKFQSIFDTGKSVLLTPYQRARPEGGRSRTPGSGRAGPGRNREEPRNFRPPPDRSGPGEGRRNSGPRSGGGRFGPPGRERRSRTIMAVAAPVRSVEGEIVAVIGLMIRPEQEFSRILSVGYDGQSGETFAFDSNGVMLSRSRFEAELRVAGRLEANQTSALFLELRDPGGDLTRGYRPSTGPETWPLTRLVSEAVAGNDGVDIEGFRDYRGVPVVGTWHWLDDYEFGIGTKVEKKVAFETLRALNLVFFILLLLAMLCGVGMFLFSGLSLSLRRRMEAANREVKKLGQYTLTEKISEGGMGTVYRASHALLRRDTAIKLLPPDQADAKAIKRFEQEVQQTSRLVHPNTIQVFDYGHTPDGIFYYSMEYLDGINLRDLVARDGRLSEARVIYILQQVCGSLAEAHEAGLVHRDIKPANVILCDLGGMTDMVKVLDFGLVKSYRDFNDDMMERTETITISGSPHFISPEAVSCPDQVDHRSDIYSVGALGYYLLTGAYVFEGMTTFEVFRKHTTEVPVPPSRRVDSELEPELETAILRCLNKEPERRFDSVTELLTALRRSPAARQWTEEQRRSWWADYRRRRPERVPEIPAGVSEETLQINLSGRTQTAC